MSTPLSGAKRTETPLNSDRPEDFSDARKRAIAEMADATVCVDERTGTVMSAYQFFCQILPPPVVQAIFHNMAIAYDKEIATYVETIVNRDIVGKLLRRTHAKRRGPWVELLEDLVYIVATYGLIITTGFWLGRQ